MDLHIEVHGNPFHFIRLWIVFRKVNSEVNALQCGIRSPSHSCVIATLPVLWLNHGIAWFEWITIHVDHQILNLAVAQCRWSRISKSDHHSIDSPFCNTFGCSAVLRKHCKPCFVRCFLQQSLSCFFSLSVFLVYVSAIFSLLQRHRLFICWSLAPFSAMLVAADPRKQCPVYAVAFSSPSLLAMQEAIFAIVLIPTLDSIKEPWAVMAVKRGWSVGLSWDCRMKESRVLK